MPGTRLSSSRGAVGRLCRCTPSALRRPGVPQRLQPGKRGSVLEKGKLEASLEDVASEWSGGWKALSWSLPWQEVPHERRPGPPCGQQLTGWGPSEKLEGCAGAGSGAAEAWESGPASAGDVEPMGVSGRREARATPHGLSQQLGGRGSSSDSGCWELGTALLLPSEPCVAVGPSGQGRKAGWGAPGHLCLGEGLGPGAVRAVGRSLRIKATGVREKQADSFRDAGFSRLDGRGRPAKNSP